jgi:methionyl-tRNA synthetase
MNYFVTMSIPYINGSPHIGHAMEMVQADVLARYGRQQEMTVLYSSGTDEHGTKIALKATEAGLSPQQYADTMSSEFRELAQLCHVSIDRFVRTTDSGHEQRAQIIWQQLKKDIYKSKYKGLYCVGCEAYVTEATAKENNGICPNHQKPYDQLEEENYFFRLSAYAKQIQDAIETGAFEVIPAVRRNEVLQFIKEGLDDISISRPKEKISWGIPVPDDPDHVMYVWFEALMNYITVLGYPEHQDFANFWPASVQVIGKDILRFHAANWPGILLGLGLELPKKLYVHGFITVEGQKLGKSLGNAVHPKDIIEAYGVDAFRYYFLRHIPSSGDGDFSWQKLHDSYNNELANELGNALQRTVAMISRYQNNVVGEVPPPSHDVAAYHEALASCRFDKALEVVWQQIKGLNQYIDEEKPWQIAKNGDSEHLKEVLAYQVSCLLEIAELLRPFLPSAAERITNVFREGLVHALDAPLFPKKESVPIGLNAQTNE